MASNPQQAVEAAHGRWVAGVLLRKGREELGLSRWDIALALKIRERNIIAVELGTDSASDVLRTYANYLTSKLGPKWAQDTLDSILAANHDRVMAERRLGDQIAVAASQQWVTDRPSRAKRAASAQRKSGRTNESLSEMAADAVVADTVSDDAGVAQGSRAAVLATTGDFGSWRDQFAQWMKPRPGLRLVRDAA